MSFVLLVVLQPQTVHPLEPVAALLDFAAKAMRYRALCFNAARGNLSPVGPTDRVDVLLHLQLAVPGMFGTCAREVRFQHRLAVNPGIINPDRSMVFSHEKAHERAHITECVAPELSGAKRLRMTTATRPASHLHNQNQH